MSKIPDEVILRLTYLRDVSIKKAKQLVSAGYDTIEKIASANKYGLANALGYYTEIGEFLADKLIYRASRVVEEIESGELTWDEVLEKARLQIESPVRLKKKVTPPSRKIPEEVILRLTYLLDVLIKEAKQLVHAGYDTIEEIASADKYDLADALGYYTDIEVSLADRLIYRAREVVKKKESGELTWDEVMERAHQKRRKREEREDREVAQSDKEAEIVKRMLRGEI